jgi:hypothetical protein
LGAYGISYHRLHAKKMTKYFIQTIGLWI